MRLKETILILLTSLCLVSCNSTTDNTDDIKKELTLQSMDINYNKDNYTEVIDLIINNNKACNMADNELSSYIDVASEIIIENCKERVYNNLDNKITNIYYFHSCIMVHTVDSNEYNYMYKLYIDSNSKKIDDCVVYKIV